MKIIKEKTYSLSGEIFRTNLRDIFETDFVNFEEGEYEILISDEKHQVEVEDVFDVDLLIENIQDCAIDEYGEWAEDYLESMTNDQKKTLEDVVKKWFIQNNFDPNFWTIKDFRKGFAVVSKDKNGNFHFKLKEEQ